MTNRNLKRALSLLGTAALMSSLVTGAAFAEKVLPAQGDYSDGIEYSDDGEVFKELSND